MRRYRSTKTGAIVRVADDKVMGSAWKLLESPTLPAKKKDYAPDATWTKAALIEWAATKGLDVNPKSTKAQILAELQDLEAKEDTGVASDAASSDDDATSDAAGNVEDDDDGDEDDTDSALITGSQDW
ncbi:MAG: hypothetical protein LBP28_05620 [Coriobacteriales bacterium]|jgi:hypothetical protein|nr:hypothetical protein [Coriobacteriales bacterium]